MVLDIMDSVSPLEAGREVFQRSKTPSSLQPRNIIPRPMSEATEMFDTDFEDDSSDFEEEWSPKASFETVSDLSAILLLDAGS